MNVSKIIPLSQLTINTENGEILLNSEYLNMKIENLKFLNEVAKFSDINIKENKVSFTESTGEKNTELIRFMVTIYNLIYSYENISQELYFEIINNIRQTLNER